MDQPERDLRGKIKRLEREVERRRAAVDKAISSHVESAQQLALARDELNRFYGDEADQ